ncbi:hypothetical protein HYQ43_19615 [Paracoccus pantotrophus]|uniref:Flagellar hook-length control protein FliK n=2 Tax=Paracoccaceae TaxID=31989 RepID=A0A7H9BYU4_PARPN|nr:hypothetical protein [Paracoccus pantotrophus]QLH16292.1 hypothetical protein HYQ43_19615 [Paracoccus pantotrophus]SFN75594.1 hypothetical protein SAMN04244567_00207 [Paracoccus pantotrophus]
MVISSLFKPMSSSAPAAASGAGSAPLQAVSNVVETLAGLLPGREPAGNGGVRFDFSPHAMQASAGAAHPAADEPAAPVMPVAEAAAPAAAPTPVRVPVAADAADPAAAAGASAAAVLAPAKAAGASGGADPAALDEVAAPAARAARSAARPADPDAEAQARAWAIKAQGREGAQTMVERVAALSSRPWPTDAAAERTEKAVQALKTDQQAAAPRTLALA